MPPRNGLQALLQQLRSVDDLIINVPLGPSRRSHERVHIWVLA
ncbi:hypothetical protein MMCCUG48898_2897 [Mycobacteroides abscessus subsp. massiliense CCUG 48898 = JCM 15300]|nr:hypothetical protein MMCCUG48898_2897 [Mycobacteroides abscessus subsp. massiliense CCUG 48898 = JCM 15300]